MNSSEKKLARDLSEFTRGHLESFTPGLVIEAFHRGKKKIHFEQGDVYPLYDLASLTKILFTATTCMRLLSQDWDLLFAPVRETLPWWKHRNTRLCDLFTHTAGLEWWMPYYKKLRGPPVPEKRWAQLEKLLRRAPVHRATKAVYSDLDLYLIGAFLQAATGRSLRELWSEQASDFGFKKLDFNARNKPQFKRSEYAPTEDCPWRKKVLRGEVHDENAWALGGVAPHAGLFGPISDVSSWGLTLRKAVRGEKTPFGDTLVVQEFVKRQIPREIGDFGYIFMKPSLKKTSAGPRFSKKSFGHTAFTGPSLWFDPAKDLLVVILSNRLHPTRQNMSFSQILRPRLHTLVCDSLGL